MKKIVLFQKIIQRSDLIANSKYAVYLFGDNMQGVGYGGQAGEMRDAKNAIGIPTLWSPGVFFSDADYDKAKPTIEQRFQLALDAKQPIIVIPADGLGTGLAQLPQKSPLIYKLVLEGIKNLAAS